MVSAAFACLRRQRDSLLISFALFAALYGLRLWISSPIACNDGAGRTFYAPAWSVNYVILIPALLYCISLGLPRRFERTVRVRVALEMPQRGHSAQTRAGVLVHEQDSEPAEQEIRKKQLDSAGYIAILLWHSACHRFSARPVESKTEWGHFKEFKNLPTRCLHTVAQAWMGLLLRKLR
jgi:hypothetical protein